MVTSLLLIIVIKYTLIYHYKLVRPIINSIINSIGLIEIVIDGKTRTVIIGPIIFYYLNEPWNSFCALEQFFLVKKHDFILCRLDES